MDIISLSKSAKDAYEQNAEVFEVGFLSGAAAFIIAMLLSLFSLKLLALIFFKKKSLGISLKGENGELTISTKAVEDFVRHAIAIYEQVKIDKVTIRSKGQSYQIDIKAKLKCDSNMVQLKNKIETTVTSCIKERIGDIDVQKVNIIIHEFASKTESGKQRKLAEEFYTKSEDSNTISES